jgi:hypothetical protein
MEAMVDALATTAARLRRFGAQMNPDLQGIEAALPALRELLRASALPFRLVGGLAVVHHGYERLTIDIDVLVPADAGRVLTDRALAAAGFERLSPQRLRHAATGVRVDLLAAGTVLRGRRGDRALPGPREVAGSSRDEDVAGLEALVALKLDAGRRQDLTDVLELLKRRGDAEYLALEAAVRPDLHSELAALRDEALEELSWEGANGT